MLKIKQLIKKYVTVYLIYTVSKPGQHLLYKKIKTINLSMYFFGAQTLNYIILLFILVNKYGAVLIVTDKFTKFIKLILEKTT